MKRYSISILMVATLGGCGNTGADTKSDAGSGGNDSAGTSNAHGGSAGAAGSGNALGGTSNTHGGAGDSEISDAAAPIGDATTTCSVDVESHVVTAYNHVLECAPLTFDTNPPSSGNHFLYWAAFGVYDFPLPRGYWVHNLEHGTVVVSYNCPGGCADEVAAAKSWLEQLPIDADCVAEGTTVPRAILTPDPKLDVAWAASSWGWTLRAACFDPPAFTDFYNAHVANGREAICIPGKEFRNPDGSRADTLPADCGD